MLEIHAGLCPCTFLDFSVIRLWCFGKGLIVIQSISILFDPVTTQMKQLPINMRSTPTIDTDGQCGQLDVLQNMFPHYFGVTRLHSFSEGLSCGNCFACCGHRVCIIQTELKLTVLFDMRNTPPIGSDATGIISDNVVLASWM